MEQFKLICIHGNSLSPQVFDLIQNNNVEKLCLTLPGHAGKTIGNTNSFLDLVQGDLAEINQSTASHEKFILMGHSLGGHICHHLLSYLNPAAIISIGAPPINLSTAGTAFLPHPHLGLLFKGQLSDSEMLSLAQSMAETTKGQELILSMIQQSNPSIREIIGASLSGGGFHDEIKILTQFQGKKVFIHAEQDLFINGKYTESLKLGEFRLVSGRHALPVDNAVAINQILEEVILSLQ